MYTIHWDSPLARWWKPQKSTLGPFAKTYRQYMQICRAGCGGGVFFLGSGFWGVSGLLSDVAAGVAFPLLLRFLKILPKN